jgi:hypothetical protein
MMFFYRAGLRSGIGNSNGPWQPQMQMGLLQRAIPDQSIRAQLASLGYATRPSLETTTGTGP